jgi:signal transduction histidine kinase
MSRARTRATDIGLGVLVGTIPLPHAARGSHELAAALLVDLLLVPAIVWRRSVPTAAFGWICGVALAGWIAVPVNRFNEPDLSAIHVAAALALLIAFYTVAVQEPRRRTLTAAVVLEVALLGLTVHLASNRVAPVLFVLLSGTAAAAGISGDNVRTRRAYLASLEARAAALEVERDQQAQLAAATERARIARDMHDVVAHNLSVMIALADGASFTRTTDPQRAADAMDQVATTGRQALGEMRRLLGVLRDGDHPAALQPQPCLADLETLLAQVRLTGLRASLTTDGPLPALPAGLQMTVYRLVQESLTNTLKHSVEAESATVRLRSSGQWFDVDVIDDGQVGPANGSAGSGLGIAGMRERAAVYGGRLDVGALPIKGWRVHASFDLAGATTAP